MKSRPSADTLRAYSEWLSGPAPASFDPYYSEETLRFAMQDDDVLVGPGDVAARAASCGVLLESARAGASLTVCGVEPPVALACLAVLDGTRTVAEARVASGAPADIFELFVSRTFGALIFAPLALSELERRVSHAEVVRFPGSPYEIVRAYWENMGDVCALVDETRVLADAERFAAFLGELNVVAHVGASGRSFYRPASPVVGKDGAAPGVFWRTPSVTEETFDGVRFVSGPRVGAALIGGERYQSMLTTSVGDGGALESAREITEGGLSWGRVVQARADSDEQAAPWFCPPRPFGAPHLESIRRELSDARTAATSGRQADALRGAAAVHWRLVRLHPFTSGNQSVAMSLVNGVLREALGAGIPHLVLDHLALRLSPSAYALVFERAIRSWLVADENPVRRALELGARRRRLFGFLELLPKVREDDLATLMDARRSDAALAFLVPSL